MIISHDVGLTLLAMVPCLILVFLGGVMIGRASRLPKGPTLIGIDFGAGDDHSVMVRAHRDPGTGAMIVDEVLSVAPGTTEPDRPRRDPREWGLPGERPTWWRCTCGEASQHRPAGAPLCAYCTGRP